jgi:hypothetical protein
MTPSNLKLGVQALLLSAALTGGYLLLVRIIVG